MSPESESDIKWTLQASKEYSTNANEDKRQMRKVKESVLFYNVINDDDVNFGGDDIIDGDYVNFWNSKVQTWIHFKLRWSRTKSDIYNMIHIIWRIKYYILYNCLNINLKPLNLKFDSTHVLDIVKD